MDPTTNTTSPFISGPALFEPPFGNTCPSDHPEEQPDPASHDNTQRRTATNSPDSSLSAQPPTMTQDSMWYSSFRGTTGAGYNPSLSLPPTYEHQPPLDSMALASATFVLSEQEHLWANLGFGPLPESSELLSGPCCGFETGSTQIAGNIARPPAVATNTETCSQAEVSLFPAQAGWQYPGAGQGTIDGSGQGTSTTWEQPRIQVRVEIPAPSFSSHHALRGLENSGDGMSMELGVTPQPRPTSP